METTSEALEAGAAAEAEERALQQLFAFWKTVALVDRLAAIDYLIAKVPDREDYDPEEDGRPTLLIEKLARRLNMRALFLLRDRQRATKMLDQYGPQSLGSRFIYVALRSHFRQRYAEQFQAMCDAASTTIAAQEDADDWSIEDTRSLLLDARKELAEQVDDRRWAVMGAVASLEEAWQAHAIELLTALQPRDGDADPESSPATTAPVEPDPVTRSASVSAASTSDAELIRADDAAVVERTPVVTSAAQDELVTADLPGREEAIPQSVADDIEALHLEAAPVDRDAVHDLVDAVDEPLAPVPVYRLTGLDRAMVDFILNTAIGTPGAQSVEEVLETCDEWSKLSTHRFHSYYCLGLAHGLLGTEIDGFARPEMNEPRCAWYATGRIAALQRRQDQAGLRKLLEERSTALAALVGRSSVRPLDATRGAARQLLRQALGFLVECGCWPEIAGVTRCAGPYLDRPLLGDLYRHISDLVATNRPVEADAVLTAVLSDSVPCSGELRERMRRRWAQAAAMQNKLAVAEGILEELTGCGYADVEARALVDLSLLKAGLAFAAQIRLPEGAAERRELLKRFVDVKGAVELALTGIEPHGGAVARADGLAFLAVVRYLQYCGHGEPGHKPTLQASVRAVEDALRAVQTAKVEHLYRLGGTLGLLLAIEAILCFEHGDPVRGMAAWKSVPHETGRLSLDDLHALVLTAAIVDPASAEAIVDSVLRHRPVSEVRRPDTEWLGASANLRRSHFDSIETLIVTGAEKADLYDRLLRAARRANDREIALRCLDALYRLGVLEGQADGVLGRLLADAPWEGLWTRAEASEALADLCVRRRRKDEALGYLEDSFEAAMLDDDTDYAGALLARMQEVGLSAAEYEQRAARLSAPSDVPITLKNSIGRHLGRAVRITFVGGDERQAAYDEEIQRMLREEFEDLVEVQFIHPGWSSNWGRTMDDVAERCEASDAVVLMRFMRTLMGRTLRERLTKPWISCSGHGRKSIHGAIVKAAQVAVLEQKRARGARI
jgi:hypothetical protein